MKSTSHIALGATLTLALSLSTTTLAQLSGLSGQVENTVERTVQAQTERAQEQAQQVAEQAAEQASQQATERATERAGGATSENILDRLPDPANRVTDRLPDVAERVQEQLPDVAQRAQDRLAERAETGIAPGLQSRLEENPLGDLPPRLDILDHQGERVFTEIQIAAQTRALDSEWLMLLTPDQLALLESEAADLLQFLESSEQLDGLGGTLVRFRLPEELNTEEAVRRLVPDQLRELLDRNLIYTPQADSQDAQVLSLSLHPVCETPVNLGMIDSAIEIQHPAFSGKAGTDLITRSFLDTGVDQPPGHGTAVTGILIGRGPGLEPLLPNAKLYAASVVYSQGTYHRGATLAHLLNALNWLTQQDLQVINMSLTGPPSISLQKAIEAIQQQGKFVVAAAGNDGPHSGPRYPAAYTGVVAATAVEPDRRIYPWANQGDFIDFAALGVSINTARAGGQFGAETGTSMASPIIAAFLACTLAKPGVESSSVVELMQREAIDLGVPGYDPIFGYGLLHPDL